MTYKQICDSVDAVGGYITDPVGKCLRTTANRKGHRIDLDYLGSETYAAFERREDLSHRFNESSAMHADLIWVQVPSTGEKWRPYPILVDRVSGIIRGQTVNGVGYGFLADVEGCIHYHSDSRA